MLTFNRFFSVTSLFVAGLLAADDGSECVSSWHDYDSSSALFTPEPVTSTISSYVDEHAFDYDVPYTTLCDGYRRAVTSRETASTEIYDPPVTETDYGGYSAPTPSCTIPETACTALVSSYSSALSDYATNDAPSPTIHPHCATYVPCTVSPDYCFIHDNYDLKVFYWPVTTVSGDFCAYNGSTIFAQPTSPPNPNTAVLEDGFVATSPTNYISFSQVGAYIHGRRPTTTMCGPSTYDNVYVPVTGPMTTKGLDGTRSSLNFEDLNTMKYEVFKAQRRCRNNACTVIEGFYTPELALPTEVLDLEPVEWKAAGCKGTDGGTSYYHPSMVPLVTPAPSVKGKLL